MALEFSKRFGIAYVFTYLIASFFQLPLNFVLQTLPNINILNALVNMFIFLINFITFVTNYPIINIILWISRFIVLIELIELIRGV